jgi:hypothetical protein
MIVLCPDNYSKGVTIMTKHLNFDNRLDIEKGILEKIFLSLKSQEYLVDTNQLFLEK